MTLDGIVLLQARAAQCAAWVVAMRADVNPRYGNRGWRCAAAPIGDVCVICESSRTDLTGWCEAIEACHERWRRAVAS